MGFFSVSLGYIVGFPKYIEIFKRKAFVSSRSDNGKKKT